MLKIYDRNEQLVKTGDDMEVAGFEYDLLTQEEANNSDFGYFHSYNDSMTDGETREVIWISLDGEQEIVVGSTEYLGEDSE